MIRIFSVALPFAATTASIVQEGGVAPAAMACPGTANVAMIKYDGVRPGVEVMVNGRGPYLFLIDTGAAGQMRADSSLVESASLPLVGDVAINDGSNAGDRIVRNARIDRLTLGAIEFRDLSGPSRSYNGARARRRIDGILGFDLFGGCLLTLDYARGRVIVAPGALSRRTPGVIPYDRANGSPGVTMTIGRVRVHADLDSGSNQGFSLPWSLAPRLRLDGAPRITGYGESATNRFPIRRARIAETVRIGGVAWRAPTVEFTETFDFANIGSEVWPDLRLTFDQRHHLVRLTRPRR
jgi:hypothetical protein